MNFTRWHLRLLEYEPAEPADSCPLVLVTLPTRVELEQPKRLLEWEVASLPRGHLGKEHVASFDGSVVAGERRALRGHERMFA
jgi:hypothetical protein